MDNDIEKLKEELQDFQISGNEDTLAKLKELCFVYSSTAEDMVGNWVAYTTSKNRSIEPTLELLAQFEKEELLRVSKTPKNAKSQSTKKCSSNACDTSLLEIPRSQKSPLPFSPDSFSSLLCTPSAKYASRKASGDVVHCYGNTQNIKWSRKSSDITIDIHDYGTALQEHYSFMFEKFRDYASVLNDMIDDLGAYFQRTFEISAWADISLPAMDPVPVVGRICTEFKLDPDSILLEGSIETSSGNVMHLNVESLKEFSFFPGQIIAGQGINSSGKKLVLQSLYQNLLPPFPKDSPDINNGLIAIVAAGPFTTSDNLLYEPLEDLMKYVKANEPDVCILLGPIVDIRHEEIEKGNLALSYHDMFLKLFSTIMSHVENTQTKIVLIPSLRDAHHSSVYPTPPYEVVHNFKNLHLSSDPCVLNINGVIFGITSTDILLHLGKEEIHYSSQSPEDRLCRLSKHILKQRNFYPLYPPAEDMNIDYLRFESHCLFSVTPHILILPSDLRYFVKDLNGCCCLNPERLSKSISGGTFGRIMVSAIDCDKYSGSIIDSIKVEIVKI